MPIRSLVVFCFLLTFVSAPVVIAKPAADSTFTPDSNSAAIVVPKAEEDVARTATDDYIPGLTINESGERGGLNVLFQTLLGGALSLAGSFLVVRAQVRNAGKIRLAETVADRRVVALSAAYGHFKELEAAMSGATEVKTLALMESQEKWLIENRLFLPDLVVRQWWDVRAGLRKCVRERARIEMERAPEDTPARLSQFELKLQSFVEAMLTAVLKEMDITPGKQANILQLWEEAGLDADDV